MGILKTNKSSLKEAFTNYYVALENPVQSQVVDCELSDWGEWSTCSKPCAGGDQKRTKEIVQPPFNNGKPCEQTEQTRKCNEFPCAIDCEVGDWSNWTTCNKQCNGGIKYRTREKKRDQLGTGKPCPVLRENAECNKDSCIRVRFDGNTGDLEYVFPEAGRAKHITVSGFPVVPISNTSQGLPISKYVMIAYSQNAFLYQAERANPKNVNNYSMFNYAFDMTKTHENITRIVFKVIVKGQLLPIASLGNQVSPTLSNDQIKTITAQFDGKIDCEFTDWTNWSPCTVRCGAPGTESRTRTITRAAANGGIACPTSTSESQTCNISCNADCVLYDWKNTSDCSKPCGSGTLTQTRDVRVAQSGTGRPCDTRNRTLACNTHNCPIDCVPNNSYGPWSGCGTSGPDKGKRFRTRTGSPAQYGGRECTNEQLKQSENCPVNCVPDNNWTEWSACPPGGGIQTRTCGRAVTAMNGGADCTESQLKQTRTCTDCVPSVSWSPWSACENSGANKGTRFRTRTGTTPTNGGKACIDSQLKQSENCPVSCVPDNNWTSWSGCPSGGGTRTRTRGRAITAVNGGTDCTTSQLQESLQCVDCVPNPNWNAWSACGSNGIRTRNRTISVYAQNGGKECTYGMLNESQSCQNCVMSTVWENVGGCTAPCGQSGNYQRQRRRPISYPTNGGAGCPVDGSGYQYQNVWCNGPANYLTRDWYNINSCSRSCGGGTLTQQQDYSCGGRPQRVVSCNTHGCPVNCSGGWTWSGRSSCKKGQGRCVYRISQHAANGGGGCRYRDGYTSECRHENRKCSGL